MRRILEYILKRIPFLFPEDTYLKIIYWLKMGTRLDLDNPQARNEKIQWLKLYNRRPEYTDMVDKIKVKDYVREKIGGEYVIPTIKEWDRVDDIDIDSLPDKFVLKANFSGDNRGVVICSDKSSFDAAKAKARLRKSLKLDIYKVYREWPYKNVRKRFFAEEYIGKDLIDYKFHCFDGYVDCVMLCLDRQKGQTKFYFFDRGWNFKRYNYEGKDAPEDFTLEKPEGLDKMFELASELSAGIPYVRVDFYNVDGKIYFGEITFFPASGFDKDDLPEYDLRFGQMIDLTKVGKRK